jgi:hypothetical protein
MKYISMVPANDWFFVHPNDASSKKNYTVHHLAVWALTGEGNVVGLLPVVDSAVTGSTTAKLVPPPPIRGEYVHRQNLSAAMLEALTS